MAGAAQQALPGPATARKAVDALNKGDATGERHNRKAYESRIAARNDLSTGIFRIDTAERICGLRLQLRVDDIKSWEFVNNRIANRAKIWVLEP